MSGDDLVQRGRIEPVAADIETAQLELEQAKKHLGSAELLRFDLVTASAVVAAVAADLS